MNRFMGWIAMGGYSLYVWPAYGIVCTVLILNLVSIRRQRIRTNRKLQAWLKNGSA